MNCTNCGAPLPDNGRFCEKCGTPAPNAAPTGGVGANNTPGGYQAGTPAPTPYPAPTPAPAATAQTASVRLLVKAALAIAILCFILPFVTVSCDYEGKTEKLATYQGIDLLFGEKYENDASQGADEYGGKLNPYLWAAFGLTIASLVLVIKKKDKIPYILSGIAALAMLIFRFSFASFYGLDTIEEYIDIDFWFIGFYLSLLMMIAATVGQWFAEAQEKLPTNAGANFGGGGGGYQQPAPINIPVSQMGGQPNNNNNQSNTMQGIDSQSSGVNLNK